MSLLLDEALDQWNCLAEQEKNEAYRIHPASSKAKDGPAEQELTSASHDHKHVVNHSCPTLWREKICEWCYQVVDHCVIERDVVGIALFYFDKYASCQTPCSESVLQLVAMTSLFLAVKLHSTRKISVTSIVSLGRGCFQVDQILKMELCIMKELHWHLNPPTPSTYSHVVNPILDACTKDAQASYEISELSRYLLELSVCDVYFADKQPSSIAYASILVATENLSSFNKIKQRFAKYKLDKSPQVTELCAMRLRHVYRLAMPSPSEPEDDTDEETDNAVLTPAFVFDTYS